MLSGPVFAMVWEGLSVIKQGRNLVGATNPADAVPGTIRGDYCVDIGRNCVHASAVPEDAVKEIGLWFPDGVAEYTSCIETQIYE